MVRLMLLAVLFICGCVPDSAKRLVQDKHAQLYVYTRRIDNIDPTKHPTPSQNEEMIKALSKDMESLDKILNNWKPNSTMKEADLDGNTE